jgi:Glycosyl transferase family 2
MANGIPDDGWRGWRVPRAWLEHARADALRDRERARAGAPYVLGASALRILRRPWELASLLKAFRAAAPPGIRSAPPCPPVPPSPPAGEASRTDAAHARALAAEVRALRAEIAELDGGSAARLGHRLLHVRARPWRLPLLPLIVLHHLLRARAGSRRAPAPLPTPPVHRPRPQPRPAAPSPRWACLGPAWLREMLAFEGALTLAPGGDPPRALLVALQGRADETLQAFRAWRRGAGSAAPGCPAVVWLLDDGRELAWARLLQSGDRVYAADPGHARAVAGRLARPVAHLPLAVQPLLHNPIEWWSGRRGIRSHHEDGDEVPAALRALVALARGGPVDSAARIETHLGTPLPMPAVPDWADPALGHDLVRHARLRRVLRHEAVGVRLRRLAGDLGLAVEDAADPLVTVVTATIRPHLLGRVLASFAAQTYPRKELVLVLHGARFDGRAVEAAVRQVEAPVRVCRAPDRWTLGHCLQRGCDESAGRLVCFMDDDNRYGPRYVEDLALAMRFSEAGLVGKGAHLVHLEERGRMVLVDPEDEHCYRKLRGGGRLMLRREILDEVRWRPMRQMVDLAFIDDCEARGVPMLAADRFHFVRVRGRAGAHTSPFLSAGRSLRPLPAAAAVEDLEP